MVKIFIALALMALAGCASPGTDCTSLNRTLLAYEACRDDPKCQLTAREHFDWLQKQNQSDLACKAETDVHR